MTPVRCLACGALIEHWSNEHRSARWGDTNHCWTCGAAKPRWWRLARSIARWTYERQMSRARLTAPPDPPPTT